MRKALTPEQFLLDVAAHKMTVLRSDGLYRHIKFKQPGANGWNQWFQIVTWPGFLCISGDMGSYVFSRIEDMFEFFRSSELKINPSYWAEKCEAHDRTCAPQEYDADVFKSRVFSSLDGYGLSRKRKAEIIRALKEEVFSGDESYETVSSALYNFEHDGFEFLDIWEISSKTWTFRYLWCLYAIVWGIQQLDKHVSEAAA